MINSAIILAGGKGERLRPLTDKVPKPMIEVLGRPLVEYQVLLLADYGIKHIVFSCGYKHQVLQQYFGDGSKWGMKIDYAVEDEPLGRGGAFKNALKFIPGNEKIIYGANGDEIIAEPLGPMIELHQRKNAMATIFTVKLVSPFGIIEMDNSGRVLSFKEKPELPHWINAGIYIFDRGCIELFPDVGDHETEVFPELVIRGKIFAFKGKYRGTVNTTKDLDELIKELPKHFTRHLLKFG